MTQIENRDYVIVVDRSGSMTETDCPGGKSRWEYMKETLKGVMQEVVKLDPDGITLYTFNANYKKYENIKEPKDVESVFAVGPMGSTLLSPVLTDVFSTHFSNHKRPTTVVVFTDGEAGDTVETTKAIIGAASKLEGDEDLAISFIQVGKDKGATKFLQMLDDDLQKQGAKFDIVDTKTCDDLNDMPLADVLLAAIND